MLINNHLINYHHYVTILAEINSRNVVTVHSSYQFQISHQTKSTVSQWIIYLSPFLWTWELGSLPLVGKWKLPGWTVSHDGEWFG